MMFLFAILGLVLGSFGNVLIARLPKEESIGGRSKCPHCGRTLRPQELIPLMSFLFLEGKCAGCRKPIAWQYPLVEAASALLFVLAYAMFPYQLFAAAFSAIGLWALLLIAVIDAKTQTIPDVFTLVLGVAGVGLNIVLGNFTLLAPVIGVVFFGAQWLFSKGKWVGSGDVLLAMGIGLFLSSWQWMLLAMFSAYIVGAAVVVWLLLFKQVKPNQSIAFGPFLVIGAIVAFVWGEAILKMLFV